MPDRLTDAVVEIGTQLRRIADHQTTADEDDNCVRFASLTAGIGYPVRCPHCGPDVSPVPPTHWTKHVMRHHPDVHPDAPTTPVYCPLCPRVVPLADPQTATEHFHARHPEHPFVGPGPWPRLCPTPETHNWGCGCPTDTGELRMELHAQDERIEELEERRDELAATLREVLDQFADWPRGGTLWPGGGCVARVSENDWDRWDAMETGTPRTPATEVCETGDVRTCTLACPMHGTPEPATEEKPETPPQHIGNRVNAEDCPACSGTNPPYPFICPGPQEQP